MHIKPIPQDVFDAEQILDRHSLRLSMDSKQKFNEYEDFRYSSVTHGVLYRPFKKRRDKFSTESINVGYYVGYEIAAPMGWAVVPAVAVGLGAIDVTDDQTPAASGTTTTPADSGKRMAFTKAWGLIMKDAGNFQIGLFAGVDRLGKTAGSTWMYEGKVWTSIGIGYDFGRQPTSTDK